MNYSVVDSSSQTTVAAPFKFGLPDVGSSLSPYLMHDIAVPVSDKPSTVERHISRSESTSERLFNATAKAKQWTSQVAMRLNHQARLRFFRQLDRLHNEDEWFEGDRPVDLESYKTFVRAYASRIVGGKPALALAQDGRIIAIWQDNGGKLTIEFFSQDKVRYLVSQIVDGERERFAGDTSIGRLSQVLSPFESARWFNGS